MTKIPVGATVAQTYRFVFANLVRVLKVTWLAALLNALLQVFTMQRGLALTQAMAAHDPSALAQLRATMPFYALMFILACMQAVAVAQLALGRRDGRLPVAFPLGAPLWRLIGTFLLAMLAFMLVILGMVLAAMALAAVGKWLALSRLGSMLFALVLLAAMVTAMAYLALRLFFLITPLVIDRESLALEAAWSLTRGNFWRLFLLLLAVILPLLLLKYLISAVLAGSPSPVFPHQAGAAGRAALRQAQIAWEAQFAARWYVAVPVLTLFGALFHALSVVAQVFAYRALGSAPVAGDALPD